MKRIHAALVLGAGVLAAGAAWAHGGATGIVKERMDAMSDIGRNVKSIGQMIKGVAPYDPVKIANAGGAIAVHGGEALTELFPEGSLQSPSEASPAIWTDWTKFSDLAANLQTSALALKTLADQNADRKTVAGAFGKVAATCKSCHEAFRIKK
ncbi:MAG: cytochrome c [Roseibium sp.]|uniref:c-type cytochrome n=1 Tax=Roseibium sp. TaxID=1936156 RepID=UPI002610C25D|nr:cytochrome c [Roseibium sp.]MCV0425727.1 cytochrome c [Roseibium sp.]